MKHFKTSYPVTPNEDERTNVFDLDDDDIDRIQ